MNLWLIFVLGIIELVGLKLFKLKGLIIFNLVLLAGVGIGKFF